MTKGMTVKDCLNELDKTLLADIDIERKGILKPINGSIDVQKYFVLNDTIFEDRAYFGKRIIGYIKDNVAYAYTKDNKGKVIGTVEY